MDVEEIALLLRRIGLERILALEKRDPQYSSVCSICKNRGEGETARLVMMNALISYRLTGRGEEHWDYFSRFFSQRKREDLCAEFLDYVRGSPYLAVGRNARIKRALSVCGYMPDIDDLLKTWKDLVTILNADSDAKTIVFTIKMLNYVYMCCRDIDRALPYEIPIPVDYRVAKLTSCLGLVDLSPEEALRRYKEVQRAWHKVSQISGIPPLHIDTLLWLAGRVVLYGDRNYEVPAEFLELVKRFCGGQR